jgi:hypothetical protein
MDRERSGLHRRGRKPDLALRQRLIGLIWTLTFGGMQGAWWRPAPRRRGPGRKTASRSVGRPPSIRLRQGETVHRLEHQNAELQHGIEGGLLALSAAATAKDGNEFGAEQLEIHCRRELLKRIALREKLTQSILNVPKARLASRHCRLALAITLHESNHDMRSSTGRVSGGVQLPT